MVTIDAIPLSIFSFRVAKMTLNLVMELKHLIIGVVIFALLGLGLFYLGSLLTKVEEDVRKTDGPPPPIAELFNAVEGVKAQAAESQKKQEEMLKD